MSTSLIIPSWLSPNLLEGLIHVPQSSLSSSASGGLDQDSAWKQFQRLQKNSGREVPTIFHNGFFHRIIDFEPIYNEGLLYYTQVEHSRGTGVNWILFYRENPHDPKIFPVSRKNIFQSFLTAFTEVPMQIQRHEVTMPEFELIGVLPLSDGREKHTFQLQNGHRFCIEGFTSPMKKKVKCANGVELSMCQLSISAALKCLEQIPLVALTQMDVLRLSVDWRPELQEGGNAFKEGPHFVVVLHPFEAPSKSKGTILETSRLLQYTLYHEIFGHGLSHKNRFLARELIKIFASYEEPMTAYSSLGVEEWFAEGCADFWPRYFFKGDREEANKRKKEHPLLTGLILHVVGVLEGWVEPASKNIAAWAKTMRSCHNGKKS